MRDIQIKILRVVRDELSRHHGFVRWQGRRWATFLGITALADNRRIAPAYPTTLRDELDGLVERGLLAVPSHEPGAFLPDGQQTHSMGAGVMEVPDGYALTPGGHEKLLEDGSRKPVVVAPWTLALAILFEDPEISVAALAEKVGVPRTTLYSRSNRWKGVRATLLARDNRDSTSRGWKNEGGIEAADPDSLG